MSCILTDWSLYETQGDSVRPRADSRRGWDLRDWQAIRDAAASLVTLEADVGGNARGLGGAPGVRCSFRLLLPPP